MRPPEVGQDRGARTRDAEQGRYGDSGDQIPALEAHVLSFLSCGPADGPFDLGFGRRRSGVVSLVIGWVVLRRPLPAAAGRLGPGFHDLAILFPATLLGRSVHPQYEGLHRGALLLHQGGVHRLADGGAQDVAVGTPCTLPPFQFTTCTRPGNSSRPKLAQAASDQTDRSVAPTSATERARNRPSSGLRLTPMVLVASIALLPVVLAVRRAGA